MNKKDLRNADINSVLNLSVRAMKRIQLLKVKTIEELTKLESIKNPMLIEDNIKATREILSKLNEIGLRICMTDKDWEVIELTNFY